jgi:hypothetical protein
MVTPTKKEGSPDAGPSRAKSSSAESAKHKRNGSPDAPATEKISVGASGVDGD